MPRNGIAWECCPIVKQHAIALPHHQHRRRRSATPRTVDDRVDHANWLPRGARGFPCYRLPSLPLPGSFRAQFHDPIDLSEADLGAPAVVGYRARQAAVCHRHGILSMRRFGRQAVIPQAVVAELGSDAGRGTGRLTRTVPPQANALRCRPSKLLGRAGPVPRDKIGSRDKSGSDGNLQFLNILRS